MSVLENLEPQNVFYYLEEICKIPHPSYKEKKISDFLAAFAKERGLECYQDDLFNIIMIKEATEGYENAGPLILQGHMDMVCEKEEGVEIDFENDPLKLRLDGDLISAEGTTLGGDDGVAVAYILALFSDETLCHPRLEAVITVSEEVGMEGAKGIDLSMLRGHKLLNIDSDHEGIMLSSCAGGSTAVIDLPVKRSADFSGHVYEITINGLLGGHSGSEIDKERANSNFLMARLFLELQGNADFRIISMEGGSKQNAIPRQTTAQILVADDADEVFHSFVKKLQEDVRKEFAISDPDIRIQTEPAGERVFSGALDEYSTKQVILLLSALPNGVQSMSSDMKGLVKTSLNLGILKLLENEIKIEYCVRSSIQSERKHLERRLCMISEGLGAKAEISAEYPAWEYRRDSAFRNDAIRVYKQMYDKEPKIEAIHAGVECGILASKIRDIDAISIGPDMWDIHTTEERLSVSSTRRVYEFVKELIRSQKE